jgi:hypothetical protein
MKLQECYFASCFYYSLLVLYKHNKGVVEQLIVAGSTFLDLEYKRVLRKQGFPRTYGKGVNYPEMD